MAAATTQLVHAEEAPGYVAPLRALLLEEWHTMDALEGNYPAPIILLEHTHTVIGGLAFTHFKHPEAPHQATWINALLVIPAWRGRGLAKQLLASAEVKAQQTGVAEIFALSDQPQLYQRLGWTTVGKDKTGTVLRKTLGSPI